MSNTVTFNFDTLLADSRALVSVSCEVDQDGDIAEFNHVLFEGFNVHDILSDNQWTELEWDAKKAYDLEYSEQETIDYDHKHTLEAVYGLSKPSFNIR
jgi:hypothetical protein